MVWINDRLPRQASSPAIHLCLCQRLRLQGPGVCQNAPTGHPETCCQQVCPEALSMSLHKDIHKQGKGVSACDMAVCLLESSIKKLPIFIFTLPLERGRGAFVKARPSAVFPELLRPAEDVVYVWLYDCCASHPHPFPHFICYSKCSYDPRIIPSLCSCPSRPTLFITAFPSQAKDSLNS